jgi:hypothetical protein
VSVIEKNQFLKDYVKTAFVEKIKQENKTRQEDNSEQKAKIQQTKKDIA